VLDAATFFASAGFLALLRIPDIVRREAAEHDFHREVVEGARHIVRTPELLRLVVVFAIALGVVGFLESAIFDLVDRGLGRDPEFVGVTSTVQGIGSVTGGLVAAWALRRFRELAVIGLGSVVCGTGLAPQALATLPAVFGGLLLIGAGIGAINVGYMTILQRRTAKDLQGRVFAASEGVLNLPYAASIGAGAALVGVLGYEVMYLANAVVLVACGVYLLTIRVGPSLPEPTRAGERLPTAEGIVPP
jgi:MFS family permease